MGDVWKGLSGGMPAATVRRLPNNIVNFARSSTARVRNRGEGNDAQGRTGLKKVSQNSGHTRNRSTIERRCVERHPHPNLLPEGTGVNSVDNIT